MDVDTEALRWFQHVADGMTVTEVADVFGVSQPGVSRALARVEAAVGAPLLHRTGRVLRPTHAGSIFKRHVDAVLHRLDDGLASVAELVDPETGTVSLAFQLSLGTWLVPALLSEFRHAHPGVRFQLQTSDDAWNSPITAGRVDLEFTARRPEDPDVRWEHLFSQPLALAVPAGHRFAGSPAIDLADAADEEFVALGPSWELRAVTEALCSSAGFAPRVCLEADDLPVVQGLVEAGLGIAVLPVPTTRLANPPHGFGTLVPLTNAAARREVGLARSMSRRLLPSAALFRQHVLARRGSLQRPATWQSGG